MRATFAGWEEVGVGGATPVGFHLVEVDSRKAVDPVFREQLGSNERTLP